MRRYFVLTKKYAWEGPYEANSASHAVELFLTRPQDPGDATLPFRIVKVELTGEIIELKRIRGTIYE